VGALREQATAHIEQNAPTMPMPFFHRLMATLLMELGEYRRAIAFFEEARVPHSFAVSANEWDS
jgi:hypothetical protein